MEVRQNSLEYGTFHKLRGESSYSNSLSIFLEKQGETRTEETWKLPYQEHMLTDGISSETSQSLQDEISILEFCIEGPAWSSLIFIQRNTKLDIEMKETKLLLTSLKWARMYKDQKLKNAYNLISFRHLLIASVDE